MLSYKLVIELTDEPNSQAAYQEAAKVTYTLASNLSNRLDSLPPEALSAELALLSAPQLASLIAALLSHHMQHSLVSPENTLVVSSFTTKLAIMVANGPFSQVSSKLASDIASLLDPKATNKVPAAEVCRVAYNLASLLAYETVYQPTIQPTTQPTTQATTQPTTQATTPKVASKIAPLAIPN
jgi:hypothetical protein